MKTTNKTDTIRFTLKGQVVIPSWLRKGFEIEEGTRALVYQEGDAIVLKPITSRHIRNLRGSLKGAGVLKSLLADRGSVDKALELADKARGKASERVEVSQVLPPSTDRFFSLFRLTSRSGALYYPQPLWCDGG